MRHRSAAMAPVERAHVDLIARGALLKEKTEILRQQYLAARRGDISSHALWPALTKTPPDAMCPTCQSALTPVPPNTGVLLACPKCGFVARPLVRGS